MENKDIFNDPHAVFEKKTKLPVRHSVIKNNAVRIGEPKKIEQTPEPESHSGKTDVQPIIENNQVTGIVFTCSCGKVSEIRFDFDE